MVWAGVAGLGSELTVLAGGGAMAPSSGGKSPYERFSDRQRRLMEQHLNEHSYVSPFLTLSRHPKFLIEGDQGQLRLSGVGCEGASLTFRKTVQHFCRAILAALHTRNLHRDKCLQDWFLWACLHGVPVSMCWLAGCANGIPNMSEQEWSNVDHGSAVKVPGEVPQQTSCQSDAVSGHLQTEQHVQHSYFSEHATAVSEHASPGNLPVRVPSSVKGDAVAQESASLEVSSDEINRVPNSSLLGALLQFGMPAVDDQVCEQPDRVAVTTCMQIVEQVGMKQDSGPALAGCQVSRHMTLPVETSKAKPDAPPQQRQGAKLVGCGDALVPYMCSAVASLQVCFAYLCGMRVGEASHPGPEIGQTDAAHQVKHDHSTGVRVGEAKNPGPSPFGPELENMIKQYVMEAVREAIKEAFQNLGFSAPVSSVQTAEVPQGGQQAGSTSTDKPGKGSPKGKSKPHTPPSSDKARGKGKEADATKPLVQHSQDNPPPRKMSGSLSPGNPNRGNSN